MSQFKVTRSDGRSNAQVILDHVKDKQAGSVFTYGELAAALSANSNHTYTAKEARSIASGVYSRLLKEQGRALHNVRNVGYRIAPASMHVTLANGRKHKADLQMLRGLQTLQHVKWEEMDANQRAAHEGQLLVVGALYQQMQSLEKRQGSVEEAIKRIMPSIEQKKIE